MPPSATLPEGEDPPWVIKEAVENSKVKAATQTLLENAIRGIDAVEKGETASTFEIDGKQHDFAVNHDLEQHAGPSDSKIRPRLWMMGAGNYTRRITLLIREKGLQGELDQIWVQPGPTGMRDPPGKPPGPIPILELVRPSEDGKTPGEYLFHSTGIVEYIESRWPTPLPANITPSRALELKALVRDRMAYVDEIVLLASNYSFNASAVFTSKPSSREAAISYWQRCHETLASLEKISDPVGPYLVPGSGSEPTLVDICLFAWIQNFRYIYKVDALEHGHERALRMYEAFEKRPTSYHNETLGALWRDRTWDLSPRPDEIPWKVYEFPRESLKKPLLDVCTVGKATDEVN